MTSFKASLLLKNFVNILLSYKEQFNLNFIYSRSQMIKSPRFNLCFILGYKTFLKNSDLFQENEEIPISGISNPRMILKTMSQCLCKMKWFWNEILFTHRLFVVPKATARCLTNLSPVASPKTFFFVCSRICCSENY
jgi:hypothetical protein